jgi:hypothetical protein
VTILYTSPHDIDYDVHLYLHIVQRSRTFWEASVKVLHSRVKGYDDRTLTLFFKGFCFAPNVFVRNLQNDNSVPDAAGFETRSSASLAPQQVGLPKPGWRCLEFRIYRVTI